MNIVQNCVHIYVNTETITVETIPAMGGREIKNSGGGKFKYDMFDTL
jgi:hypothetical protein